MYQFRKSRHEQGLRHPTGLALWATAEDASPSVQASARWQRNEDVKEYVIDDEGLLYHPVVQLLCHLNETAMFIWRNCDGLESEALAVRLAEHFRVDLETARRHVTKVLELFSVSGFVASSAHTGAVE